MMHKCSLAFVAFLVCKCCARNASLTSQEVLHGGDHEGFWLVIAHAPKAMIGYNFPYENGIIIVFC